MTAEGPDLELVDRPTPVVRLASDNAARASQLRLPSPKYRLAVDDDIPGCAQIWRASLADYLGRLNQPVLATDLAPLERLLRHLRSTDPERFWVATRAGQGTDGDGETLVGFGSANVRGKAWFLAMLFVDPPDQGDGVGRTLLERTLTGVPMPGSRTALSDSWAYGTATDAAQPISNALYARIGIVPRVPVLHLVGRIERPAEIPGLRSGIRATRLAELGDGPEAETVNASLDALDRELLGYDHRVDRPYLENERRIGIVYREGERVVGYGFTSSVGRVGPVAALDADLLAPILGDLLQAVEPNGAYSLWLPGTAGDAVSMTLRAGFRMEGFPALLCWSRPYADFARYIPTTLALL